MTIRNTIAHTLLILAWGFLSCSKSETQFTDFYWIDRDTIAQLEVPEGFQFSSEKRGSNSILRLIYSDSSFILLACGLPDSIELLDGKAYILASRTVDNSNFHYPNPERQQTRSGRLSGKQTLWEERKVKFAGWNQMNVAHVGFSESDIPSHVRFLTSLRPYVRSADRETFLDTSKYIPTADEVDGHYFTLTEGSGASFLLRTDMRYSYSLWAQGQNGAFQDSGTYSVRGDTLELFGTRKAIQDSINANSPLWEKKHVYYIFKRIGSQQFIVPAWRLNDFAQVAIEQGGLPTQVGNVYDVCYAKRRDTK